MRFTKLGIGLVILAIIYFFGAFTLELVLASTQFNDSSFSPYYLNEDTFYIHNFTVNLSTSEPPNTFTINTINWSQDLSETNFSWITLSSSSQGLLDFNATLNNQTGRFNITMSVVNGTGSGDVDTFYFIINASNDAPTFTNINSTYNLSENQNFLAYLNGTDEESHYPLNFTVTFLNNCTHATWSGRNTGENCSLYNFNFTVTNTSNITGLMNFTPVRNDVGTYWADISVTDYGANYSCPHQFCDNSTYKVNQTTNYSTTVLFNILSTLVINTSECDNKVFQENQVGTCNIAINTKGETDNLSISTYSILRNYASGQGGVSNTSWFFSNLSTLASNFQKNITINVTPGKTEIGNWTINFTVNDFSYNQNSTSQIYVYVNKTTDDVPDLLSVNAVTTSINLETVINLTVHDDDLLIPDKNQSYGGYNESTNFSRTILNRSNLSQQLSLSNFSIRVLQMPASGTNRTSAEIRFSANTSDVGNYTVNVSIVDNANASDNVLFNLSIINNTAPQWNTSMNATIIGAEDANIYLNLSQNVSDPENDSLTYSYTSDTAFSSFSLNSSNGVIDFTPLDVDVGQHIVNITVSDGYLSNLTSFNFTITNINDNPLIKPLDATNASPTSNIANGSTINVTEDNLTTLTLWIEDNDLRIPSVQKSYYNENFTLNLAIQGVNTSLFTFSRDSSWWPQPDSVPAFPNRTKYDAIFTPRKPSNGNYNVTLNATDSNNASYVFIFYLSISSIEHNPSITTLSNQTSAVNRSFYYDANVSDTEDGNDTSGTNNNFTFRYSFLNDGINVSFLNSSVFNSTTGVINLTFNSTQDGEYHLNMTVNDSSGRESSSDFWLSVYGLPNVSFPASSSEINLTENVTSVLNFTVNHSVADNLTYMFYIDSISYSGGYVYGSSVMRYNTSYYGNGTSLNWSFMPNMTDETYGQLKNLTLVVYPNSSSLANASSLNTTIVFKLNITHTNSPISFTGHISDPASVTHDNDIALTMTDYFTDSDLSDNYYNQSITWTVSINSSSVTGTFSGSRLNLSASIATSALINVTGEDSGTTNATSNSFVVVFTEPTSSTSTTSGGGGGGRITEVPVSLKILLPDPISAYQQDRIELPISLFNDGKKDLKEITLNATIVKNGTILDDIKLSFSENYFASLEVGQKKNITLVAEINTSEMGLFEITINADVKNPKYNDWGKLYLTIKEGVDIREKILFTEEFIVQNPECVELRELVNEAKKLYGQGNTELALKKSEQAIDSCKNLISQAAKPKIKQIVENKLFKYLIISTISAFVLGIAFYSYKRMKLRRRQGYFTQQGIKNRSYSSYHNRPGVNYGT